MEKSSRRFNKFQVALHIIFWVGSFLFFVLVSANMNYGRFRGTDNTLIWPLTIGLLFNIGLFYANSLWLFAKYFKRNYWHWYIVYVGLLHLIFIIIEGIIDYGLVQYYYPNENITGVIFWYDIVLLEVLGNTIILIASVAYAAIRHWVKNERFKRQLLEEKLKTELAFLRTQINPHFLFNCLNNLYSLALQEKIQETAEGISKLSMLMRYTLHESSGDKVNLKKELAYIEDYLALQNLRIAEEDDIFIKFDIQGEVNQQEVAPMLLIPFIENAFKHGLSLKSKTLIKILLKITDGHLFFEVCNTINHAKKNLDAASGLGLANVKRRLELLYPQQYQLDIHQSANEYQVALKLSL